MPVSVKIVTQKELRARVESNLGKHTVFSSFFGDMIRTRMNQSGWLNNALVQLVIMDARENISLIEDILEKGRESAGDALQGVRTEIRGNERGFDRAIYDVWAEVNAIYWLINNGFSNLQKIERSGRMKTPDFGAFRDGDVVVEVKNFRAPSELSSAVLTAIECQHLKYPSLYDPWKFQLVIDDRALKRFPTSATDDLAIKLFCDLLNNALMEGQRDTVFEYQTATNGAVGKIKIDCSWEPSDHFGILLRARSNVFARKVGVTRLPELMPLLGKTWDTVDKAYRQLTAGGCETSQQRIILLNWQKPSYVNMDDELQKQYGDFVSALSKTLEAVDENLSVHLM